MPAPTPPQARLSLSDIDQQHAEVSNWLMFLPQAIQCLSSGMLNIAVVAAVLIQHVHIHQHEHTPHVGHPGTRNLTMSAPATGLLW